MVSSSSQKLQTGPTFQYRPIILPCICRHSGSLLSPIKSSTFPERFRKKKRIDSITIKILNFVEGFFLKKLEWIRFEGNATIPLSLICKRL